MRKELSKLQSMGSQTWAMTVSAILSKALEGSQKARSFKGSSLVIIYPLAETSWLISAINKQAVNSN